MSGEISPEDDSNVLSRMSYWWLTPLLQLGARTVLRPSLIYRLPEEHQPDYEAVRRDVQSGAALHMALVRVFAREWLLGGSWRLLQISAQAAIPFILRRFVMWVTLAQAGEAVVEDGLLLAFLLGLFPILDMVLGERSIWLNQWTSARVRACLVLLVGQKVIHKRTHASSSSSSSSTKTARGNENEQMKKKKSDENEELKREGIESPIDVATLIASDVDRIQESAESLHFLWRTPLVLLVVLFTIATMLGIFPALAALLTLLAVVSMSAFVNTTFSALRKSVSRETDKRVGLTTELIKELENIKSVALESFFVDQIISARDQEEALLSRYRMLFAVAKSLSLVLSPLVLLSSLVTFVLLEGQVNLSPEIVFATLVAVKNLQLPFQNAVDVGVSLIESRVSLGRVRRLLVAPEATRFSLPDNSRLLVSLSAASFSLGSSAPQSSLTDRFPPGDSVVLSLIGADDDLFDDSDVVLLHQISLSLQPGDFLWVCGRVGAGKVCLV